MPVLRQRTAPVIRRSFTGLVAANAETDHDATHSTLRIGGEDVLTTITDLIALLPEPVVVAVALDGDELAYGKAWRHDIHPSSGAGGCADGCCSDYEDQEFGVGATDVLDALDSLHGEQHMLEVTLIGYVEPQIEVEFAHHTLIAKGDSVTPGTVRLMGLRQAEKFRYRMTTESRLCHDAAQRKERDRIAAL